jgi:hypothetical protein
VYYPRHNPTTQHASDHTRGTSTCIYHTGVQYMYGFMLLLVGTLLRYEYRTVMCACCAVHQYRYWYHKRHEPNMYSEQTTGRVLIFSSFYTQLLTYAYICVLSKTQPNHRQWQGDGRSRSTGDVTQNKRPPGPSTHGPKRQKKILTLERTCSRRSLLAELRIRQHDSSHENRGARIETDDHGGVKAL